MELQFHKTPLPGLQLVKREVRNLEETQEFRIPETLPDVGTVLGAWGQVLLRGKEWRTGSAQVSGGVQVWVLYEPEDGGELQTVETWIPFQARWDIPDTVKDGTICAYCLLRNADARSIASGKLMIRVNVGILGEMWSPMEAGIYQSAELPEDIQLLKCSHKLCVPAEAGEKPFVLDEELTLPGNTSAIEKVLRCSLQPELIESKIMSNKVIFRGAVLLHVLYRGADEGLHTWDFELPFSQYSELEREYEQGSTAQISVAVTSMELQPDLEGRWRLKAGFTGQYVICDMREIELTEDAYSPLREVKPQLRTMELPVIMERCHQTVQVEQTVSAQGKVIDCAFYPDHPVARQMEAQASVQYQGQFRLLYQDEFDHLQMTETYWEGQCLLPFESDAQMMANCVLTGKIQPAFDSDGILLHADLLTDALQVCTEGLPGVAALEMGEQLQENPDRPSLILRRAGNNNLWQIAKQSGSSVDAICAANQLEGEPAPEQMLLIPVL